MRIRARGRPSGALEPVRRHTIDEQVRRVYGEGGLDAPLVPVGSEGSHRDAESRHRQARGCQTHPRCRLRHAGRLDWGGLQVPHARQKSRRSQSSQSSQRSQRCGRQGEASGLDRTARVPRPPRPEGPCRHLVSAPKIGAGGARETGEVRTGPRLEARPRADRVSTGGRRAGQGRRAVGRAGQGHRDRADQTWRRTGRTGFPQAVHGPGRPTGGRSGQGHLPGRKQRAVTVPGRRRWAPSRLNT